jgi:general secretion pathway protein D
MALVINALLFDPDYNSKRIQVVLKDVTPLEVLRIVGEVSNTFWKPVTHNTIFVAQDSRAKRTALSQQAVQIFYLKNVTQQNESSDVQTAIRNLLTLVKECKDGLPTPGEPFEVAPLA